MSASAPLDTAEAGQPLSSRAIATIRNRPTSGMSRRSLLRRSLGLGVGVAAVEGLLGMLSFVWPKTARGSARVRVGTLDDLIARNGSLPIDDGFPAYVADARAFVMTIDPSRGSWTPGVDPTGDGTALNVRAAVPAVPAPRLPPESLRRGLLVPLPVPPVAVRPAGNKADGRPVWSCATRHGSLPDRGRSPRASSRSTRPGWPSVRSPSSSASPA